MIAAWSISMLNLVGCIILYILVLMFIQTLIEQYNLKERLSHWLGWLMSISGLEPSMSFLWIVANIVGYAYGAGIIKAARREALHTIAESANSLAIGEKALHVRASKSR